MMLQAATDAGNTPTYPRYLDAGETALVVEFGDTVDPAINKQVLALDAAFAGRSAGRSTGVRVL